MAAGGADMLSTVRPGGLPPQNSHHSSRLPLFAFEPFLHFSEFLVPIRRESDLPEGVEEQVERFD